MLNNLKGNKLMFNFQKLLLNKSGVFALLMICLLAWGPVQAGDPVVGAQKAHTCLGCHGVKHYVNTYPTYHVPKIAGQHEAYIIAALQSYRSKTRGHRTMQANAGLLTDTDIEDIAAYFAGQAGKEPKKIPAEAGITNGAAQSIQIQTRRDALGREYTITMTLCSKSYVATTCWGN